MGICLRTVHGLNPYVNTTSLRQAKYATYWGGSSVKPIACKKEKVTYIALPSMIKAHQMDSCSTRGAGDLTGYVCYGMSKGN